MASSPNEPPCETDPGMEEFNRPPSRAPDFERENRVLVSLTRALADSPRTAFQSLVDTMLELFRAGSAGISILLEDGKQFHWPATAGAWKTCIGKVAPREIDPCAEVLARNGPLLFSHLERRYADLPPETAGVEECLMVPFILDGKPVGAIWVMAHDVLRKFDGEDLRMLTSLSIFASMAQQTLKQSNAFWEQDHQRQEATQILREVNAALLVSSVRQHELVAERKRSEAVVKAQNERLVLLWDAARVLLSTEDPDAILNGLYARVGPQLGADICFNYMVDETGNALRLASHLGISDEAARSIERREFGHGICGTVAMTGQPIAATYLQPSDDPMGKLVKSMGIRAHVCIPLKADGRLLGTLSFASRTRDEFDSDEQIVLQTISHYVAVAYERMRLLSRLRETDRRKDEFLAMLGHELRNPLAPIHNAAQLLGLQKDEGAIQKQARVIIERQVGKLTRLVDDLLEISRITTGKIRLQLERTALNGILERAVESVGPLMEQRQHKLTVSPLLQSIWIHADATRLEQVIVNLLNNAAKYTPQGGYISVVVQQQADEVILRVRDNGVGIAPEILPNIFDLFMQAERSLDRSQGGLGIGLCLVRSLVEMHGGRVDVTSTLGEGSEFVVRLPALRASVPSQISGPAEVAAAIGPSLRVLVVDDNVDAAESLGMLLKALGHEIELAYDGPTSLQVAARFRPDVILLDLGLPGIDGYEVARQLSRHPVLNRVVLVALTGYGQDSDRKRSLELGFNFHLVKPADFDTVKQILATVSATVN